MKVMEDYSTSSFILEFVRFSCKVGYPKKLISRVKMDNSSANFLNTKSFWEVSQINEQYQKMPVDKKINPRNNA